MHPTELRVARLAAHRLELVTALEAVLPRLNATAETTLAYVVVTAFWGFVLYLILLTIGS